MFMPGTDDGQEGLQDTVDQELSAKFESELQMEQEMSNSNELPSNIQEFLDNGPFQV